MDFLFSFSGRIGRGKWWLGQGIVVGLWIGLLLIAGVFHSVTHAGQVEGANESIRSPVVFLLVGALVPIWVNFATTIKRLHDRDKSPIWILLSFVPLGSIWLLLECGVFAGTPGSNSYGPPPTEARYNTTTTDFGANIDIEAAMRRLAARTDDPVLAPAKVARPVATRRSSGPPAFGKRA